MVLCVGFATTNNFGTILPWAPDLGVTAHHLALRQIATSVQETRTCCEPVRRTGRVLRDGKDHGFLRLIILIVQTFSVMDFRV